MRAIWTGAIGFGLVNIPVRMYSAVQDSALDLDMLDQKDHANIKFKRVNADTGKEVPWERIVKGYEVNGRYVVLNKSDFEKVSPEKSKIINIDRFVDLETIDPLFFETPYFLEPQKGGEKAYYLLEKALDRSGKAGLASFVMHEREHICLVKPGKKGLVLHRLRFAEEIRDNGELNLPAVSVKNNEMKMALELIRSLSGPFQPTKYKDEYRKKLLQLIKARSKGKTVPFRPMKVVRSDPHDLLSQLKASLHRKKAAS